MSAKESIPQDQAPWHWQPLTTSFRQPRNAFSLAISLAIAVATIFAVFSTSIWTLADSFAKRAILSRCAALKAAPGPPEGFYSREESDRFEPGTNATLIRNCLLFTGKDNGTDVIRGDILLDKGIIKGLGKISGRVIDNTPNLTIINANGAWVTPGLVDLHTHLGVLSVPILAGAVDLNSAKGPIAPWLRSIDGLNTHDEGYQLAIAGGVTSVQVLPGSMNAIGGQAFMVKLRKPSDRSASSMLLEPPYSLTLPSDGSESYTPFRWRHMKQACGENLRGYGNRMDTMWSFRVAYTEAMKIKLSQDDYCAKAEEGLWDSLSGPFPEDVRWEMLVDVLRGKVKISSHCYEVVDLDAMVRLSNEFQFSIASFHHASEAYLVPNLLKRMWGGVPSVAIVATNHRYKREAFRGSEFAPRSDHPEINSRHLIYEAQQAHYFGLPPHLALAAVTSTPAGAAGLSHRIGILEEGFDADVVLWDSHPLQLGATPVKVWIDGVLQIPVPSKTDEENHVEVGKGKDGDQWQQVPDTPNWDKEREKTILWDGLPPLEGKQTENKIVFTNVKEVWKRSGDGGIEQAFSAQLSLERPNESELGAVVVEKGRITCIGRNCAHAQEDFIKMDLHGGSISPGLMTFGSPLGFEEIASEPSTGDGETYDAFRSNVPKVLDDVGGVVRAMDALMFGTRNALTAYRSGVTLATSSLAKPIYLYGPDAHIISGLSVAFRTGSAHVMQRGAIIQDVTALHVIAGLRRLLYGWESNDHETGAWFKKAAEGIIPLVIEVDSLDIMANLLILKNDVEDKIGSRMRMVFSGAMEAHLLAEEISDADVGVILIPSRSFPMVWDQRRMAWEARNTRFDAALESNGRISEQQSYALVTKNLEDLLGIRGIDEETSDLVAFDGGSMFDLSSKAVGVILPSRGVVDLF
ncbi:carbohydrate esterase family 9 protein [Flammula alnicola]|nr:carbohydrate esterase family 9 protein [Flammula alnicola]